MSRCYLCDAWLDDMPEIDEHEPGINVIELCTNCARTKPAALLPHDELFALFIHPAASGKERTGEER